MDNFIRLKKLGQGSFGYVYKVKRKSDNKLYALKWMEITKDALNEVRLLASLEHPNIIKFFEAFPFYNKNSRNIRLSIIMEYANNGDLAMLIKKNKLSNTHLEESRIWKYVSQMSSALYFLHENGILHRDIKAANCFLTKDDTIKIGDMNISKVVKQNQLARTKIGTPYYMSPEVWNNIPYNQKSDVWALGCLVYELAAFKVPFTGYSVIDLSRKINRGSYIKKPNIHYTHHFWKIVNSMLKVKPYDRASMKSIYDVAAFKYDNTDIKNNIAPIKNKSNENMNMLKTIKMTPVLQKLTSRMPKTRYNDNKSPYNEIISRYNKNPPFNKIKSKYNSKVNSPRFNNIRYNALYNNPKYVYPYNKLPTNKNRIEIYSPKIKSNKDAIPSGNIAELRKQARKLFNI